MLWRETLQILMLRDQLDYRMMPPLARLPSAAGSVRCPSYGAEQPVWKAACDALASVLEEHKSKPFRIDVQLSDSFVHYQVLEARTGIATRAEWRAYALHAFSTVHGDAVKDWDFRIDPVPPGQSALACAIDNALLATLRELATKHTSRLVAVRPQFVKLFNRQHFANQQPKQRWFAVVEERHACLGMQTGRVWRTVRNEAAPDGWQAALPGMIRRVRAAFDPVENGSLYLCGNLAMNDVPAIIEGLPVHAAETSFLRVPAIPAVALES